MDPKKPKLNLPAGMETSLRLDPLPNLFPILPKTPSPSKKTTYSDRFIPCRSSSRLQNFSLIDNSSPVKEGGNELYTRMLRTELFGADAGPESGNGSPMSPNNNLFRYKMDHGSPSSPMSTLGQDDLVGSGNVMPPKVPRKIQKTADKVLDALSLQDDFYLNLVDWSSQNMLAVGLGSCVYLWNASSSKVTKLCDLKDRDEICAVQWTKEGSYLAVGTSLGDIEIWDGTRCKRVRTMGGHNTRAGVLSWSSRILASGSRDKNILQHDIRASNDFTAKLVGHRSEVCGLKWSHDDRWLASGGNDNQLLLWNQHSNNPVSKFTEHTAAVKAIAWSPHQQGLLASGGGTADRCIKF